jgi:4a-hydroxytetrahydrobiopterin dehydratase
MAELLEDHEIEERLGALDGWRREGDAIARDLERESFASAMTYINAVAELAEAADHHPDILVHGWNKVRLTVSNHSAGGLTAADFALAAAIDTLPAA